MGIALNLQIALGGMGIFMILILPTHEYRITSHLFVISSISFISASYFQCIDRSSLFPIEYLYPEVAQSITTNFFEYRHMNVHFFG